MHELKKIAVYCGSNPGSKPSYTQQAFQLGQFLAGRGIDVVYGGGGVGLMNEIASGALDEGGRVIGVITEKLLALEVGRHDLTKLHVTPDMRTRKVYRLNSCGLNAENPGDTEDFKSSASSFLVG